VSLWSVAFDGLSNDYKKELDFAHSDKPLQPSDLIQVVVSKKEECVKKQWTLYTNKAGEKVPLRDVLGKVVDWLDRFKHVGDLAVQFDPGQAAIPWMAVRTLLQAGRPLAH
jgi:hypothetical protein